jgi:tRNA threonylcarbamoyladenosine biosynthesis protein TsaB
VSRLGLETATDRASVAYGVDAGSAVEETLDGARRHAAALLPMIDRVLDRAGAALDDVREVVVADGPGSFTGLRVGASVGRALAHARGLELWTAPSLLVRASGAGAAPGELVVAVTSALRGELYAAAYRFGEQAIEEVLAPRVRRPADLLDELPGGAEWLVGEAPAEVLEPLAVWTRVRRVLGAKAAPSAAHLIGLVGRAGGARRITAVHAWEPEYGRPAEAQARWELTHGRPLSNPASAPG